MWVAGFGLLGIGVFRVLSRYFAKKNCTVQAQGRVTSMRVDVNLGAGDDPSTTTRYVKYEYSAEGSRVEKRRRVSWLQYRRLDEGQVVTVFYQPDNPKRHYVAEIKHRWFITALFIAGGALFLFAAI